MNISKTAWRLIGLALVFWGGFLIGRKTIDTKEVIQYIKDDPVSGTVSGLIPIRETVPEIPVLPLRLDTVFVDSIVYVAVRVDTAAIINDYIASREYTPVLFDNPKVGKLSLSATVQYNKLSEVSYEFEPIYKEVTKYKEKILQPFVSGTLGTLGTIGVGGGVFYKKVGLEYQYQRSLRDDRAGHQFGVKLLF